MKQSNLNSHIYQRILLAARDEFIANGFRDASMRTIAREAGVTVSNIYNYFDNKDVLFRTILTPLLTAFNRMLEEHNGERHMEEYANTADVYCNTMLNDLMQLTHAYRPELKLLFLQAGGSSLEHFKEDIVRSQSEVGRDFLRIFKTKYPQMNDDISPLFIRLSAMWWTILFTEIFANDTLNEQEIERAFREYITFGSAGWKALMHL